MVVCFLFKTKTAYDMRISDWSSDVCSSDLEGRTGHRRPVRRDGRMIRKECPSYPISIFMAGGMWDAQNVCNAYCDEVGFCVSLTRTDFSYNGGSAPSFIVGLIHYPRFPAAPDVLWAHADALAAPLRLALHQATHTLQTQRKRLV